MCGRFVAGSPPDEIARYFGAERDDDLPGPSYNVAPTDDVAVVRDSQGVRRMDAFHWGLVPFWAKDPSVGSRMINARAEGIAAKGAFKHAFRRRRCIVPADGFYEWKAVPGQKKKQPFFIRRADGEPVAFAGLWETWRPPAAPAENGGAEADGAAVPRLRSCTIVTTSANALVEPLHDRMPVILPPSAWDAWLAADPDRDDVEDMQRLLVPAPAELLEVVPVGTAVNDVRSNGRELIEPVTLPEEAATAPEEYRQGTLL